jgi:tRNA pseudouridine55 synthase
MTNPAADGLLLVDKPAGMSSHAVVDHARRAIGTRRIGHGGTLDPFATGLLVLLVNRATRLLPFLDGEPKVYRARIKFGARTSTDDCEGDVVQEAASPSPEAVEQAITSLTGHLLQRPPAFSAKSVAGVRAYKAARRGKPVTLEPVGVRVYEWRVLGWNGPELEAEIRCSGGTYIRALARDLGEAAGSAAHLAGLRRLSSGRFSVEDAVRMDALDARSFALLPVAAAVRQLPRQSLDDLDARRVTHGQSVTANTAGDVAVLCHQDDVVAVAVREGEQWRPKVVMRDA